MNTQNDRQIVENAFALGGYGASNFHGLGFLQAALDKNIVPDMVSCTSGQIHAVWKYLKIKNGQALGTYGDRQLKNLEDVAHVYSESAEIKPKLPFPEIAGDAPQLVSAWVRHMADAESLKANPFGYLMGVTLNNIPARSLAPDIREGVLDEICHDFNNENTIGIVFNSYNPRQGCEHVYINPHAQRLLARSTSLPSSFRKASYHTTQYMEITPQGVMDALWIYEYGFTDRQFVDGAYFRQVILSELSRARRIFVARPVEYQWGGPMPITYGEKEDLKTEVFFNSSYYGERFRIELINRLIEQNALDLAFMKSEGYHKIEFYEIEPRTPKPFAGYFSESMDMFHEARSDALNVFASLGL